MYDKNHMLVMDYHENAVHTLLRERELNLFIRKTRVQSTHLMGSSCGSKEQVVLTWKQASCCRGKHVILIKIVLS